MTLYASLLPGDPAPWFRQRCTAPMGAYTFDMAAGRHVVLFFFASSQDPGIADELCRIAAADELFDGRWLSFFGVSADPVDEAENRLLASPPGIRFFWDADGLIGRLYGAQPLQPGTGLPLRPRWVLLDPMLRVVGMIDHQPGAVAQVLAALRSLAAATATTATQAVAPVLLLDHVFEQAFCERLIAYYQQSGSQPSGVFTEDASGRSTAISDAGFKRRRDCTLRDPAIVEQVQARIIRRVVPEIRKSFQFEASRLERLIVACYDSAEQGRFGPHRDNTVQATAHRRFAVSINLNDAFEGGEIVFPEFGTRSYRPPAGGALVFSCSLMHSVTPVLRGQRYACLPFVYDDAAAKIKHANRDAIRGAAPDR